MDGAYKKIKMLEELTADQKWKRRYVLGEDSFSSHYLYWHTP